MRHPLRQYALIGLLAAGAVMGGHVNAREYLAELGLQAQPGTPKPSVNPAIGSEAVQVWQNARASEYTLYAGTRSASGIGLRTMESYGGIVYSLPGGWGSSVEAGFTQETLFVPRRYTLAGQLHTSLSDGRALSVGLKLGAMDTDAGLRYSASGETPVNNSYSLTPWYQFGAGFPPSYQLQMNYQHSIASSFGLALGREVEAYMPYHDPTISGPRQLTITGQHWLTPSWALSYDVLSQDATSPLRLQGLRLGMRYRF